MKQQHGALYLGTIGSNMKFEIASLPTNNKIIRLPKDECDKLSEKQLGERLTEACKPIFAKYGNLYSSSDIHVL